MRPVDLVVLHHSGSHNPNQTPEGIKKYHVEEKGYNDVAYHHMIDFEGIVHRGRAEGVQGAHCKNFNDTSIGICVFGEFGMNEKQAEALYDLCAILMVKYDLSVEQFKRHKDLANTLCPAYDIDWLKQALTIKGR